MEDHESGRFAFLDLRANMMVDDTRELEYVQKKFREMAKLSDVQNSNVISGKFVAAGAFAEAYLLKRRDNPIPLIVKVIMVPDPDEMRKVPGITTEDAWREVAKMVLEVEMLNFLTRSPVSVNSSVSFVPRLRSLGTDGNCCFRLPYSMEPASASPVERVIAGHRASIKGRQFAAERREEMSITSHISMIQLFFVMEAGGDPLAQLMAVEDDSGREGKPLEVDPEVTPSFAAATLIQQTIQQVYLRDLGVSHGDLHRGNWIEAKMPDPRKTALRCIADDYDIILPLSLTGGRLWQMIDFGQGVAMRSEGASKDARHALKHYRVALNPHDRNPGNPQLSNIEDMRINGAEMLERFGQYLDIYESARTWAEWRDFARMVAVSFVPENNIDASQWATGMKENAIEFVRAVLDGKRPDNQQRRAFMQSLFSTKGIPSNATPTPRQALHAMEPQLAKLLAHSEPPTDDTHLIVWDMRSATFQSVEVPLPDPVQRDRTGKDRAVIAASGKLPLATVFCLGNVKSAVLRGAPLLKPMVASGHNYMTHEDGSVTLFYRGCIRLRAAQADVTATVVV